MENVDLDRSWLVHLEQLRNTWINQDLHVLTKTCAKTVRPNISRATDQRIHLLCAFTETMTTHVLFNTGLTTITSAHIQILPSLLRNCSLQSRSGRCTNAHWVEYQSARSSQLKSLKRNSCKKIHKWNIKQVHNGYIQHINILITCRLLIQN